MPSPAKHQSKLCAGLAIAAATLLASTPAAADGVASGTYQLQATVPVACWVRAETPVVAESGAAGSVVEACNSPGGFSVSANYRPLGVNETASIVYGGSAMPLSKGGLQLLRQSNLATIRSVNYQFANVDLQAPLVLSLTIQPL